MMSKSRLETFSDGVFAIVITILVLELSFPVKNSINSLEVLRSLFMMLPQLLLFFFSFITLATLWISHHKILSNSDTVDSKLVWANSLLLMFISLIPFATSILGHNYANKAALMTYSFLMIICSLLFSKLYRVANSDKEDILKENIKEKVKVSKRIKNKIYNIFTLSYIKKMRHIGFYSYTASFLFTPFSILVGYIFLLIPLIVYTMKRN